MQTSPVRSPISAGFKIAVAFGWLTASAPAAELAKAQLDFFEGKIRPILTENCYKCHSAEQGKSKGDLTLDTRDGWSKGGKTGPAIVPGNPDKSLLIQAVRYTDADLQMPPKGEKLSAQQIADLTAWVKMGAPDPRAGNKAIAKKYGSTDAAKAHWAFQPVARPAPPSVKQADWPATPIDNFILAALEEKGMKPSAPTDKRTLIRRATFDLIGLPPTPAEVKAFLEDNSDQAFAKVIDRLLASPQYGERWGRYWLDTARYSDTKGEVKKRVEDFRYPFAWTYRDYVIRAFNDDKPYDRFLTEQIAADKLPLGADRSTLAAMGFLTLGERFNGNANDVINDRIDVVTKGALALTVTCARCHDHMFDPIPTKDYYSLHGVFASSMEPREKPIIKPAQGAPYADYLRQRAALEKDKTALESSMKGGTNKKAKKKLQGERVQIEGKLNQLDMSHPGAPARAMIMEDRPRPADSPVFIRGEAENKGDTVPRRFLEVLSGPNREPFRNGSGRLELAQAIVSKSNPLTARVMVNRIWMHHFGEGFVTTPDDFGTQSAPPSHPALLDYLATRFMDDGWSIKKMHKLIMLSRVYQQSSAGNARYAQMDPGNRLLWRANVRRLEFEALRDSLLALGGKLDLKQGGQPVNLTAEPFSTRRTIYGAMDRSNVPEVFNQFDFANPDITTGKRYETTVPQQSLFLMNAPLVVEQAKNLITRPDFGALKSVESRITLLYELIFQRPATALEIKLGLEFLEEKPVPGRVELASVAAEVPLRGPGKKAKLDAKGGLRQNQPAFVERAPLGAWQKYAHALLQTNEAAFVN